MEQYDKSNGKTSTNDGNKEDGVVESWETAGEETGQLDRILEQRAQELKKQQEQLAKQLADMEQQPLAPPVQESPFSGPVTILRRPDSTGDLARVKRKGQQHGNNSMKSLEEREKAYAEARQRIFGKEQEERKANDARATKDRAQQQNVKFSIQPRKASADPLPDPPKPQVLQTTNLVQGMGPLIRGGVDVSRPPPTLLPPRAMVPLYQTAPLPHTSSFPQMRYPTAEIPYGCPPPMGFVQELSRMQAQTRPYIPSSPFNGYHPPGK